MDMQNGTRHPMIIAIVGALVGALATGAVSHFATQRSLVAEYEAGRQAGLLEAADTNMGNVDPPQEHSKPMIEESAISPAENVEESAGNSDQIDEQPAINASASVMLVNLKTTRFSVEDAITFDNYYTESSDFNVSLTDADGKHYENCLADIRNSQAGLVSYSRLYQVFYVRGYTTLQFDIGISDTFIQYDSESVVRVYNITNLDTGAKNLLKEVDIDSDFVQPEDGYTIDISDVTNLYIEIQRKGGSGYTIIGNARVMSE